VSSPDVKESGNWGEDHATHAGCIHISGENCEEEWKYQIGRGDDSWNYRCVGKEKGRVGLSVKGRRGREEKILRVKRLYRRDYAVSGSLNSRG